MKSIKKLIETLEKVDKFVEVATDVLQKVDTKYLHSEECIDYDLLRETSGLSHISRGGKENERKG